MKSVLISIQPKWCELIAQGKKTVEVRKTKPKLETPFKVYIYETKGKLRWCNKCHDTDCERPIPNCACHEGWGKVIGEFVCDFITNYQSEFWDDETFESIQKVCEPSDFAEYGEYDYHNIADNGDNDWRENKLCKVSCLTIEELREYIGQGINEFYGWHISDLVIYDEPRELSEFVAIEKTKCPAYLNGTCLTRRQNDVTRCENLDCPYKKITRPPQSWCYVEKGE